MKNAVPSRHSRVLLLCACSAALHFAILAWVARDAPTVAPPVSTSPNLSVRLLPPGSALAAARPDAHDQPRIDGRSAPPAEGDAAPAPAPGANALAASKPAPIAAPNAAPTAAPNAAPKPATRPDGGASGPAHTPDSAPAAAAGTPSMQMPGSYAVSMPATALITYAVVHQAGGAAPLPGADARLDWRTDGNHYVLDLDGVLGRLHSEGQRGDSGVLPRRARDDTDGAARVTEFDGRRARVLFGATGAELPGHEGIQDRASLLMQLAGIGLANPDQIGGAIGVVVAGTADLRVVRFATLGMEDVVTGAGTLAAWHLAEQVAPGTARLDVWLAPARGWLPVQLRVVQPNGDTATQTLRTIAVAPDSAPDSPPDSPPSTR